LYKHDWAVRALKKNGATTTRRGPERDSKQHTPHGRGIVRPLRCTSQWRVLLRGFSRRVEEDVEETVGGQGETRLGREIVPATVGTSNRSGTHHHRRRRHPIRRP
jgi:hypothetical protein